MNNEMKTTLWIVSPCYNEADTIKLSVPTLIQKIDALINQGVISKESRVLLVDDGSVDDTWKTIHALQSEYSDRIESYRLKQNSGETRAYMTGMQVACEKADVIVTIDCDLQDDIAMIEEMLQKFANGAEIVYGCRNDRQTDTLFYRFCANSFYLCMRTFGSKIVPHFSSFMLVTKNAVCSLCERDHKNLFIPAELPLLGLRADRVTYARKTRIAGKSRYNYGSLTKLACSALKEYTLFFETMLILTITLATTFSVIEEKARRE